MNTVYQQIKKLLKEERWVLFVGTPCQTEGLYKYLNGEYEKLLIVDLVCYGVSSPGIWQKYMRYLSRQYKGQIVNFNFRDKRNKDNGHSISWINRKGEMVYSLYDDLYCQLYFRNLIIRPSCHKCPFCTVHRNSDFTIGDFWGIEHIKPEMDDGMGTSLVITHSEKAEMIWKFIQNKCVYFSCEEKDVLQPRLIEPTKRSEKRSLFMKIQSYLPFSLIAFIFRKSKFRRQKMEKKIGILTFHCSDNCGAMLQAYGLKTWLCSHGKNAEIVNYIPLSLISRHWLIPIYLWPGCGKKNILRMALKGFYGNITSGNKYWKQRHNMKCFRRKYLTDNHPKFLVRQMRACPYETYIVGSDQIWSPDITNGLKPVYFGAFESRKKQKVIAYAASMGNNALVSHYDNTFKKLLQHVDVISLREEGAQPYIEKFGRNANVVLDPVFLLGKEKWHEIEILPKEEHYILVYATEPNADMYQFAFLLAKKKKKQVYFMKPYDRLKIEGMREINTIGPAEFLGYVDKADYVITNSLHVTAFSIIFQKSFLVFLHKTKGLRLLSVLKLHGLEDRIWKNGKEGQIDDVIDWDTVMKKNQRQKEKAEKYLRDHV